MLNTVDSSSKYQSTEIKLVEPSFGSTLTDLIIDLDYLRRRKLTGTTNPKIFFQLKSLFHTLESIGSARIEGNHTTIAEFIETKFSKEKSHDEKIVEIRNNEKAMDFIDDTITDHAIDEAYIRELHKMVVIGLSPSAEGDSRPGEYRVRNVQITKSSHIPPDYLLINDHIQSLVSFINREDNPKYDLLKIALTHHRFVWIHPFTNGNGRTVRLLTYAQLVKYGFNIHIGHIVNPTAIFCNNRNEYYNQLANADTGEDTQLLNWCQYVLSGLKIEIEKIDRLLDYSYLSKNILLPSLIDARDRKVITPEEESILKIAVEEQVFQASDLNKIFPGKLPSHISRLLNRMKEKKMIVADKKNGRKYLLYFENNYLLRSVIKMLDIHGFLPLRGEI